MFIFFLNFRVMDVDIRVSYIDDIVDISIRSFGVVCKVEKGNYF